MKKYLIPALGLSVLAYSAHSKANPIEEAVDGLAQGCYAIQSPSTASFVKQTSNGGGNYAFNATGIGDAAKFFFKPTRLKHFMLTSESGSYLGAGSSTATSALSDSGASADWNITATQNGGGFRFSLRNVGVDRNLYQSLSSNTFVLASSSPSNSESQFDLVPASGCVPHPEMQVNVAGNPDLLQGNVNAPIRGLVDAHTHLASYEMLGGEFLHGTPSHPYGVAKALPDSASIHGSNGSSDIIGNLIGFNDINHRYDTAGWPTFPSWPNNQTVSHTGYYYKWIERAWLGGVRMMVSHMVDNKALCSLQSNIDSGSNSCDAMDAARFQVQRHFELQDYIDAQYGGPGKGWMRIVTSPEQARQVIADGKLAVIMGLEFSEVFDCGVQGACSMASIEKEMQEMYDLGIRGFFPTHRFDNKLGGSEVDPTIINAGQGLSAGYMFDVKECDAVTKGRMFDGSNPLGPLSGLSGIIGIFATGLANPPNYDPNIRSCNQQGLKELGAYVINRMVDMGFLIELDHTSADTADAILDILEQRNYGGVISAHSHLQFHVDDTQLHPNMKRIIQLGGFVAPYNNNANELTDRIGRLLDEVETTSFLQGVGVGTDMSGLANQPGPRDDAGALPLGYPFTSEFGLVFDKQVSGVRVMDYNNEGMAHFGMLADHIQDVRERSPIRIYEAMMNSAEAYLQMWQRARDTSASAHFNPLMETVRIINRLTSKCIEMPGEDDNVNEFVRVQQSSCDVKAEDQRWLYDSSNGEVAALMDPSLCMDSRNTFNAGHILLRACDNDDSNNWEHDNYSLKSRANGSWSISVARNDGRIAMTPTNSGNWSQQFDLRTDRFPYNWVSLRTGMGYGCMTPKDGDTAVGTQMRVEVCNNDDDQSFFYDPLVGTLMLKADQTKCVAIPNSNLNNGTQLVLENCSSADNQKFDFGRDSFRSRLNPNKLIDNTSGSNVIIHDYHGRLNQRWRTVLN